MSLIKRMLIKNDIVANVGRAEIAIEGRRSQLNDYSKSREKYMGAVGRYPRSRMVSAQKRSVEKC